MVRCSIYYYTRHKVSDDMAPFLPVSHERAVDVGESFGWIEFPQDRPILRELYPTKGFSDIYGALVGYREKRRHIIADLVPGIIID